MTAAIVVLALLLLYSLASRRLELWNVSAPMVFVAAGVLLGEEVLGLVELDFSEDLTLLIAEVALVILLFIDARRIDIGQVGSLPGRLLGIGMPLTIIAGAAAALLLLTDLEFWEAALIAVILAPTDASLGSAVISNSRVPVRIRQALNVESGLNDGIVVPILFLFLALAGAEEAGSASFWTEFALKQIGFGILVGLAIGIAGGWLAREAVRRDWPAARFRQLAVPALALLAWAAAGEIGGSGFIAAFAAGIALGQVYAEPAERDLDFAIDIGEALSLAVLPPLPGGGASRRRAGLIGRQPRLPLRGRRLRGATGASGRSQSRWPCPHAPAPRRKGRQEAGQWREGDMRLAHSRDNFSEVPRDGRAMVPAGVTARSGLGRRWSRPRGA